VVGSTGKDVRDKMTQLSGALRLAISSALAMASGMPAFERTQLVLQGGPLYRGPRLAPRAPCKLKIVLLAAGHRKRLFTRGQLAVLTQAAC